MPDHNSIRFVAIAISGLLAWCSSASVAQQPEYTYQATSHCACSQCCQGSYRSAAFSDFKQLHASSPPPGNMTQRYPYDTWRMYYYDRPYNAHQVDQRTQELTATTNTFALPYSNRVFEDVFTQMEDNLMDHYLGYNSNPTNVNPEPAMQQVWRDKFLEYSDWHDHRNSRIQWQNAQLKNIQPQFQPQKNQLRNVSQGGEIPLHPNQ